MTDPSPKQRVSVMRSLGAFVGHIVHAVRAPASADSRTQRRTVSHTTEEREVSIPSGERGGVGGVGGVGGLGVGEGGGELPPDARVIARRTTIEEIEVRPGGAAPPAR